MAYWRPFVGVPSLSRLIVAGAPCSLAKTWHTNPGTGRKTLASLFSFAAQPIKPVVAAPRPLGRAVISSAVALCFQGPARQFSSLAREGAAPARWLKWSGFGDSLPSPLRDHTFLASLRPRPPTGPAPRFSAQVPAMLSQGSSNLNAIFVIIGVNVAVWFLWKKQPQWWMERHFTLGGWDEMLRRPYTLVTSMFSHMDPMHLFFNMLTLYFFGSDLLYRVGPRRFLIFYMGAGLCGGFGQVAYYAWKDRREASHWKYRNLKPAPSRCLGASGAINGCVAWSCLTNPWRWILMFDPIPLPMPALLYGGVFFGKDVAALMEIKIPYLSERANVAHGGHVGGAVVGIVYFLVTRGRSWH